MNIKQSQLLAQIGAEASRQFVEQYAGVIQGVESPLEAWVHASATNGTARDNLLSLSIGRAVQIVLSSQSQSGDETHG